MNIPYVTDIFKVSTVTSSCFYTMTGWKKQMGEDHGLFGMKSTQIVLT